MAGSPLDAAQIAAYPDSSTVLLVVPEGIAYASLRRQAERYLDGRRCGVLLIRRPRGQVLQRRPRRLIAEESPRHFPAAGVHRDGQASIQVRD